MLVYAMNIYHFLAQGLALVHRFPSHCGIKHEVRHVAWAAASMAVQHIMAASHQGGSYEDFCRDCPEDEEDGDDEDEQYAKRTCHAGPEWLQVRVRVCVVVVVAVFLCF